VPERRRPSIYDGDPRNLYRWREDESGRPVVAVWEITRACDLKCKHCGSRAGKAAPDELSTEGALDVVHQLASLGLREVTLIGGEAYLRHDWHVIAAEITRSGMVCTIVTGARNLTQERVDQAVAAGVKLIGVSIDGLEETHDAQRGYNGSWRNALEDARRVRQSPVHLG
jgi:MoaA/NifB/PqqE/SkfB family radical SAM enzyme